MDVLVIIVGMALFLITLYYILKQGFENSKKDVENIMAPLEIEKRFLLKNLPTNIEWDSIVWISQFYAHDGRIRRSYNEKTCETKYFKTNKKKISPGVNEEIEIEITPDEYYEYDFNKCKAIFKIRHTKNMNGFDWEIDVFESIKMVIAEVELETKDQLKTVKIPDFIKKELVIDITELEGFSNYQLSSLDALSFYKRPF